MALPSVLVLPNAYTILLALGNLVFRDDLAGFVALCIVLFLTMLTWIELLVQRSECGFHGKAENPLQLN